MSALGWCPCFGVQDPTQDNVHNGPPSRSRSYPSGYLTTSLPWDLPEEKNLPEKTVTLSTQHSKSLLWEGEKKQRQKKYHRKKRQNHQKMWSIISREVVKTRSNCFKNSQNPGLLKIVLQSTLRIPCSNMKHKSHCCH